MSRVGVAPPAAVAVSNARAEASRRNGARSRGPKTPEGKARAARNALGHGLRAENNVVLPDEDAAEFADLEAALVAELAPVGMLQTVLARRVAVAACRLARADRLAAGTGLGPRSPTRRPTGRPVPGAALGRRRPWPRADPRRQWHAVVRDALAGASTDLGDRCAPTNRYRGAAMAEFWRALKTLKALQAEQAASTVSSLEAQPLDPELKTPAARPPLIDRAQPHEPEAGAELRLHHMCPLHPLPGYRAGASRALAAKPTRARRRAPTGIRLD